MKWRYWHRQQAFDLKTRCYWNGPCLNCRTEDRELITLRHLDGLSYQELAERLEVPQGTIMSRLYHARKTLREKLVRHSFTGFSEG